MRLLLVIDSLGSGGAQRQLVNVALGLKQRGHEVEIFVYHPRVRHFSEDLIRAEIPVRSHTKRHRFSVRVVLALREQIARGEYDAILAFLSVPSLYAELARLGNKVGALVVSERSMLPARLSVGQRMLLQFHRLADHVTVNSHMQHERLEEEFPWLRGRVSTIYNGVNLKRFSPPAKTTHLSPKVRLLAVGSVYPNKNAVGLVRALATLRERGVALPLVRWAGKFADVRGTQGRQEADRELLAHGLQTHWRWLGECHDIPALMRAHDALVHPSRLEGLPNAVCEALACGRPVLASRVGDHPRLVQEGRTGFLFDPERPDEMAEVLAHFGTLGPGERGAMEVAARTYAERELALEKCSARYEEVLSCAAERTGGPRTRVTRGRRRRRVSQ